MVRVYTKSGDKGETSLFDGSRVPKDDLRVDAYGTVDELNSVLSHARLATPHDEVRALVRDIQRELFVVGADLATPTGGTAGGRIRRIGADEVAVLEQAIDEYWGRITELDRFVVPGETAAAAWFHVARTVCRRAERLAVRLGREVEMGEGVVRYLNRLSDLLFTLGRYEDEGVQPPDAIEGLRRKGKDAGDAKPLDTNPK